MNTPPTSSNAHAKGSWYIAAAMFVIAGCEQPQRVVVFHTMEQAIDIVEANRRAVSGGLKASGSASGRFVDPEGRTRRFDLEAKLQIVPPSHMRFVLQHALGGDELEVGMNTEKWWLLVRRPSEHYYEGPLGSAPAEIAETVPLRAEQLIEALGLNKLSAGNSAQRVADDFQQLIYFNADATGRPAIEKEYWLDRVEPFLIRKVVFRDGQGQVTLSSVLNAYRSIDSSGPMLPHEIHLAWPAKNAELTVSIRRWQALADLSPEHRAFVSPRNRGARFETESIQAR